MHTSETSELKELFAPVVDKTSVHAFLAMCAIYRKHLLQIDVVSVYLHANLEEPSRYITLFGDPKGQFAKYSRPSTT